MISSLSEKINAAAKAREAAHEFFVEPQELVRSFAPDLWQALLRRLDAERDSLTRNTTVKITSETVSDVEVKLENAASGDWATLQFDPETPCIWYRTKGPTGYIGFTVLDDGNGLKFFDPRRKELLFADELAAKFLEYVAI